MDLFSTVKTKLPTRRIVIIAGLAMVAALLIWRAMQPDTVPVVLATAERGKVEASVANTRAGTINACRRARLAPSLGGRIARLNVREGDRVKAGQILLEVWNEDAAAQVRVAREQAKAARARAEEACALAEVAASEAQRAQQLRAQGFVTEERADRAQSEAKARQAGCEATRAEVEHAQARIAAAQTELDRTILRAPFAGIVAEVTGELGEYTTPSPPGIPTPPAIDLIDDRCLYVIAPIDEVDAPAVKVGMPARITLDAFPGRHFQGRVRRIAPYVLDVEKQARTVDVEAEFVDPKEIRMLLVGYSADVEIVLATHENVLRIPTQSLQEGHRVLVYRPDSQTLEQRTLKIGLSNWRYTEVVSGLKAGERVAVSLEREGVQAGARVVPQSQTAAPAP
jgi:HlyD family secretion protein